MELSFIFAVKTSDKNSAMKEFKNSFHSLDGMFVESIENWLEHREGRWWSKTETKCIITAVQLHWPLVQIGWMLAELQPKANTPSDASFFLGSQLLFPQDRIDQFSADASSQDIQMRLVGVSSRFLHHSFPFVSFILLARISLYLFA